MTSNPPPAARAREIARQLSPCAFGGRRHCDVVTDRDRCHACERAKDIAHALDDARTAAVRERDVEIAGLLTERFLANPITAEDGSTCLNPWGASVKRAVRMIVVALLAPEAPR